MYAFLLKVKQCFYVSGHVEWRLSWCTIQLKLNDFLLVYLTIKHPVLIDKWHFNYKPHSTANVLIPLTINFIIYRPDYLSKIFNGIVMLLFEKWGGFVRYSNGLYIMKGRNCLLIKGLWIMLSSIDTSKF